MTATLHIGDARAILAELPAGSIDLVLSSPPFLAVRSYLPADHPDKPLEIGSEQTPADYLDVLLDVTEACARVLAPHGSLVFELGDTYSSEGGTTDNRITTGNGNDLVPRRRGGGSGWPLDKSLCGIPTLFAWSLAYGHNLLRPERTTPPWRIRNLKPWIRTNPPVGALGDKERPATSYVVVATKARDRWFDLDAVRNPSPDPHGRGAPNGKGREDDPGRYSTSPAGAPPLDWWCHVDAVLDAELARRHDAPKRRTDYEGNKIIPDRGDKGRAHISDGNGGVSGAHLRRALQAAGILQLADAVDQSPGGYSGPHYAVWPPELAALLIAEMCPRQVCRDCGKPRRRITSAEYEAHGDPAKQNNEHKAGSRGTALGIVALREQNPPAMAHGRATRHTTTLGWSDCGHGNWRPGLVLDPFAGSGTTLMVATGHGRDAIGIDLDPRSTDLCRERVGMFLDVATPPRTVDTQPLP